MPLRLTTRQAARLDDIERYASERGHAPLLRELAAHWGVSKAAASRQLILLQQRGYLVRQPGARGITLLRLRPLHHCATCSCMSAPPAPAPGAER